MELTVISTFAGCGGSSLGYKWAGFKELLAIEWDDHAVETFKLNFDCPVWQKDIKEVSGKEILEFCNIEKGELDIFDGSPPCQGFSIAGKREVTDIRNDLFRDYKRLVGELQPKVFIMENVTGMAKGKMKGRFLEILKELKELNYNVKCKLMNSKYYGVPQSRERLMFIGIREDLNELPTFPGPSNKIITAKEALKGCDIDKIKIVESDFWDKCKPGKKFSSIHPKRHYFSSCKLHPNKPVPTIIKTVGTDKGPGVWHWKVSGRITIEMAKRLCSFPDDFKINGTYREQWARLGNAVMPKFMEAIAEHLKQNILNPYYEKERI